MSVNGASWAAGLARRPEGPLTESLDHHQAALQLSVLASVSLAPTEPDSSVGADQLESMTRAKMALELLMENSVFVPTG